MSAALAFLIASGCAYFAPGVKLTPKETSERADSTFQVRHAFVYVDGENQGVTPATVQVRRSFGTSQISLRSGPKQEVVRRFDIEWAPSGSRQTLDYRFGATNAQGVRGYDVSDLPTMKNGTYIIPYFAETIQVEDREYDLTIVVME